MAWTAKIDQKLHHAVAQLAELTREFISGRDFLRIVFPGQQSDALIRQMHEKLVEEAYEIFIVHDLNPRALSPKLTGFVQAQSWFQDVTPIVVNPD